MSVAAQHGDEIGMQTAMLLLPDERSIEDAGDEVAQAMFPLADGWHNHYSNVIEITQGFPLDPYRMVWSLEDAPDAQK